MTDDVETEDTREVMRSVLEAGLAGRYEAFESIGHGGTAEVFRARDVRHPRWVAVKVLRPGVTMSMSAERFQQEIEMEAQLDHPNILTLIDSGRAGDLFYYVALWADEGSLRDRLEAGPALGLEEARRVTREIGEALAHAHRHGIVHRDVKPENVLFRSGHAVLADFGIAKLVAVPAGEGFTQPGLAVGSVKYMSPEQGLGEGPIDGRADQYSLACVLFEMLTGDPPFTGRDAGAILARHAADRPPSLEVIRPDLPSPLIAALQRALAKRASDRFPEIDLFLVAVAAAKPSPTPRRWHRWIAAATGIALLALIGTRFLAPTPYSLTNVAVLPLEIRGEVRGDSGVGIGIAYLLEAALERLEPLRLLDLGSELDPSEQLAPWRVSSARARRLAGGANAGWLLRGTVQQHAESVTVILRLFSVNGDSLVKQASRSGDSRVDELYHLALDAVKDLLPALLDAGRDVDLAPLREQSAAAVALWMQGERQYRASRFAVASEFYERALERDSAFALSALRAAQSRSWLHDSDAAARWAAVAVANQGQLTPRYALLARGLLHLRRGFADSAVTWLKSAEEASHGWAEASTALGEAYTHMVPSFDADAEDRAGAAFARARLADSAFTPPLFHLAEIAIRGARLREARTLMAELVRVGADEALSTQLRFMAECVGDGPTRAWAQRVAIAPGAALAAAKSLSAGARQLPCAEAAFRSVLANPAAGEGARWGAVLGLHHVLLARGLTSAAKGLLDSVVADGIGIARSWYVAAYAVDGGMADDAHALGTYARTTYGPDLGRVPSTEQLWMLSVLARRDGDAAAVGIVARRLDRWADSSGLDVDRAYAASSRAHRAVVLGDTTGAIAILRRQGSLLPAVRLAWDLGPGLGPDRLLLAQLFLATHQYREAIEATRVFEHVEPISFVSCVPAALRVRYDAGVALGDAAIAAAARRALESLGRQDLLH